MIKVLFFASLREELGTSELTIEAEHLPELNIRGVKNYLIELHPEWNIALQQPALLAACDQVMVKPESQIQDGAEVAFFPPVTGG
ncbi:MoaD/ThiS family protein [Gayadomonas joobiniege]|uniref:MoaD/ThiS family protein n=1 Tax=Gayadomonas joobiniege TaxID=1234606 RepID=UPI00036543D3|nr:MoaD/ThiS family protein [Gayadomonas joobiniege]